MTSVCYLVNVLKQFFSLFLILLEKTNKSNKLDKTNLTNTRCVKTLIIFISHKERVYQYTCWMDIFDSSLNYQITKYYEI